MHATNLKLWHKNSQEYHHVVCNGATNHPVKKGLFSSGNCQIYFLKKERGKIIVSSIITWELVLSTSNFVPVLQSHKFVITTEIKGNH